ncbi:MAG: TetR family transcriptional regulator [Deltaproteobacteria bacterium]|nr:TetR family transcriptional regulator [Deltaproteobacteria bacterium]
MSAAAPRRAKAGGRAPLSHRERSGLAVGRMVAAALRTMGEHGYEAATLAAIGEAAGYSRGLATHHFGSKAELFAEVLRSVTGAFMTTVERRVGNRSGVDALLAFVAAHRELAEGEPERMRALFVLSFQSLIAHSPMKDAAIRQLLGYRDWAQRMIEHGVAAGAVRSDVDPHGEAIQFCGALFGLTLQWLIDPVGTPLDRAHARFTARLERDLRAARPRRARAARA